MEIPSASAFTARKLALVGGSGEPTPNTTRGKAGFVAAASCVAMPMSRAIAASALQNKARVGSQGTPEGSIIVAERSALIFLTLPRRSQVR